MTTFCLLHGSGQGPAGWRLLTQELEKRGHRSLAPAFRTEEAVRGAAWHAGTIVDALEASDLDPAQVVCVAHSAAGIFLPLVAERWRPRRMVFLAALVPRPGVSIREQARDDPSMFNPAWLGADPKDDDAVREMVFHDCPPERLGWAMSTRIFFYAKEALREPGPLVRWPSVPSSYVVCSDDRTLTPEWQRGAARERLEVEPVEIPGGHCPHVSRPGELAGLLERISE